ncbi:helix-turn-helix transcriptional regulator [Nocardia sp. CDC186]|uniref:Helix-turn-helix transcriptional regulator n=1 Tax=Nocardia implantans TaxID=3108168 RepID=A0ABU6ASN4_9NOCA|nr:MULTISPECIES: helix-turn-helix domain-containing protein [unclassified Nocardia]MBF6190840.1 helix-turn-helix domain-containing protein [Nocardia beijingensis]MEA3528830.1 helix-turn-helix transcriptional regulator [Nocardia sp. CDC192]MEB3510495.1 helix-turn-helix transcriptional regulator [Nocardia sp. CDC186]
MDSDNRLGAFLRARRELVRPEDFGLPGGGQRRVAGLRREEIALLAGVSADYYVRLEQGRDRHPSEQVIASLARVFALDEEGTAHLRELARPTAKRQRASRRPERVAPGLLRLMDAWPNTPALVLGRYLDVLAANPLAAAVNSCSVPGVNQVRMVFLDPEARDLYLDWPTIAADTVASLRATAGADLDDPRLTELVGELSLKSEEFRQLWARHDVRVKTAGVKEFRNPMVGDLTLSYETFSVNGAPGQMLIAYHAEPGSSSERSLALLGSLIADNPGTAADEQRAAGHPDSSRQTR